MKRACQAWQRKSGGFTLIELMVVISIIAVLSSIVLAAGFALRASAARSRASAEIQAMGVALDHYKTDVGTYPLCPSAAGATGFPNNAYAADGSPALANGFYQLSSQQLYQALSSRVHNADTTLESLAPATGRVYMTFTTSQLGNYKAGLGNTYVQDPFGYSYGYNTGDLLPAPPAPQVQTYPPKAGSGFYDLWSTGGTTAAPTVGNWQDSWISNWH